MQPETDCLYLNELVYILYNGIFGEWCVRTKGYVHTPRTTASPTRVTWPLTASLLGLLNTSVEPGSTGASNAQHSSNPVLREARHSCRVSSSQASSFSWGRLVLPLMLEQRDVRLMSLPLLSIPLVLGREMLL